MHSYGTVHHLTCPGTSQQNGRAERKLCHILDTVRAPLLSAKVPAPFWDEAALHAAHVINHIPSSVIHNQTPYEGLFGSPPDYSHLRSFGSACFVLLQPHEHNKLEPRSRLCCFLGYGETQKGYRSYDPVSHRFRVSRNVIFWEHRSFVELSHFRASLSSSSVLDLFLDEAHIPSVIAPDPPVVAHDPPVVAPNPHVVAPDPIVVAPDSPVDFSVQPPDILDPFPSSPFNEYVEDEQVEDELPNPELGSPAPTLPDDHA